MHAAQAGTLVAVGENTISGRFAVVDHGYGLRTSYCHLEEVDAVRGAEVIRGAPFARTGNTGRTTGPHLHFVVKIGGHEVDPEAFRALIPARHAAGSAGVWLAPGAPPATGSDAS